MRNYLKAGLVVLAAAGVVGQAGATTTTTASMVVSATVLSSCTVAALPMVFGNYASGQATAANATATLTVACTIGTPYNVGLNAGTGTGATVAVRKLMSGTNTLNYSLYQDAAYSTLWGNTIGTNTQTGTGTGLPQLLTVYGQAPALQSSAAGVYTDSVTVSLTY